MTPERLIECMQILSMTDSQIVRIFGFTDRLVRRWKQGRRDVPPDVAEWIEGLVEYWQAHPPPVRSGVAQEDN